MLNSRLPVHFECISGFSDRALTRQYNFPNGTLCRTKKRGTLVLADRRGLAKFGVEEISRRYSAAFATSCHSSHKNGAVFRCMNKVVLSKGSKRLGVPSGAL